MTAPVRCLIVDDEPLAIRLLVNHLDRVPGLEVAATFGDALSAHGYLRNNKVDLLFLDIHMPGLTGLDFLRSLRRPPAVIFTTAYREYAVESYELEALDYLVKPIAFPRFLQAVNRFLERSKVPAEAIAPPSVPSSAYHYFSVNRKQVRVKFSDIAYAESVKDYVKIVTADREVTTKMTITELVKLLPANFLRVHRSYLVNADRLTAFSNHEVEIGELEIPIGTSYRQLVINRLAL